LIIEASWTVVPQTRVLSDGKTDERAHNRNDEHTAIVMECHPQQARRLLKYI